jgi:tetratricopeptide (TPR) repeat protein
MTTAIAFSSAIKAPFVFDDLPSIRQNASIHQLLPLSVPLTPPPNTAVSGRPVVNFSLAVNYAINESLGIDQDGANSTVSFHVVNILLHLSCGFLLFAVIRRTIAARQDLELGDPTTIAGFTALLWLLHPIQTEAVVYVIQRTELIVSLCYLATLYASIRAWDARPSRQWLWYSTGVVACAAGMLSKEVMISAPVMVVLYDRAFRVAGWRALLANRRRALFYVTLFATSLIVIATTAAGARRQSVGFNLGVTWYQYFYTQMWAVARYLRLLLWPAGLTFDYGEIPIRGWLGIPGLLLLSALAAATIVAWTRQRWLWLGFLGAWFFLILAPSSSFVPIKTEIAAERRIYLGSAAWFFLLVAGVAQLRRRKTVSVTAERIGLGTLAAALLVAAYARSMTYRSMDSLYRDVIAKAPSNPRGYAGVGLAMFASGEERFADATAMFRKATEVDSTYFVAWQTLGVLALAQEQWGDATNAFGRALRLQPENLDAADGMARARVALRQADSAARYVDRLGTRDPGVLWSLGALFVDNGGGSRAVPYLERAASGGAPPLGLALLSLAYAQSGRATEAANAARVATANGGDETKVFLLAGRAMLTARRLEEARTYLLRALRLDPTSVSARSALDSVQAIRQH